MHKYLRTIGFSEYIRHKDIQTLLDQVYEAPDYIETTDLLDTTFITMEKGFGKNYGIGSFGEYDAADRFQIEYYYPYYKSTIVSCQNICAISRHTDRYAFSAMCEEYKLGISLIFYLQNTNGYLNAVSEQIPLDTKVPIHLSGIASSGRILLPLRKSVEEFYQSAERAQKRCNLMESAHNGDESAMETLTMYDIDQYNQAAMRIQHEDLYSIVDTSFMPAGMECDQYSILGTIRYIEELPNTLTGEVVFRFIVESNDLQMSIIINRKDLLGDPILGRRFKGDIWLQGHIDFPESAGDDGFAYLPWKLAPKKKK